MQAVSRKIMADKRFFIDLGAMPEGEKEYHYHVDDAFFGSLEQDEILRGEAEVKVVLRCHGDEVLLKLSCAGAVAVTCERCLDEVVLPVEAEDEVLLVLADHDEDGEDRVLIDRRNTVFDLGWLIYEIIETSLPLVRRHPEGECNPQMEELLRTHLCTAEEE